MNAKYEFRVAQARTSAHKAASRLTQEQYTKHFNSHAFHPMRSVLCQYLADELVGCVGFTCAADEPLFLEQYLDTTIEDSIREPGSPASNRAQIIEIGGFAVTDKVHALPLMMALAPVLGSLGFICAVCTVTSTVRRCLGKLGIDARLLAHADPSRIASGGDWGNYYNLSPVVLAGNINEGTRAIAALNAMACQA